MGKNEGNGGPLRERSAIVLGAACGYSSQQLLPFVRSVRVALPDAAMVLFIDPAKCPELSNVEIVGCADCKLRNRIRTFNRGRRLASELCLGLGRFLKFLTGLDTVFHRAAFGVAIARYFWYRDWLVENPGSPNQHVLLADTRDVLLQRNPFTELPEGKLFCGVEPVPLGQCSGNSLWYRRAYGRDALSRIADFEVLCSGVSGGPRVLVQKYLDRMCCEILRVGRRILWAAGYDQALHNHLLRITDLGADFVFEPWDSDRLTTLHYASDIGFSPNSAGELCGPQGRVVAIVHQYDRHKRLQQWADSRWSCSVQVERAGS